MLRPRTLYLRTDAASSLGVLADDRSRSFETQSGRVRAARTDRRRRIRHGLPLRAAGAAARCGHSAPYFAVGSLKLYPWPASKSTTEGRPIKKTRANCV